MASGPHHRSGSASNHEIIDLISTSESEVEVGYGNGNENGDGDGNRNGENGDVSGGAGAKTFTEKQYRTENSNSVSSKDRRDHLALNFLRRKEADEGSRSEGMDHGSQTRDKIKGYSKEQDKKRDTTSHGRDSRSTIPISHSSSDSDSDITPASKSKRTSPDNSSIQLTDGSSDSNNNSSGEEESADDANGIQVPNSSPERRPTKFSTGLDSSPLQSSRPVKVSTRLPNLRDFAFHPNTDKSKAGRKHEPFSVVFSKLRKMFADVPSATLIKAINEKSTLEDSVAHIQELMKSGAISKSSSSASNRASQRLDSLSLRSESASPFKLSPTKDELKAKRLKIQRQYFKNDNIPSYKPSVDAKEYKNALRRKQAENENIVSSKVRLDTVKKSLRDRYAQDRTKKRNIIEESDEENEVIELTDSEDELSGDDDEDSDAPMKPKRRGNRYEEDDDYAPGMRKSSKNKPVDRRTAPDDDFELPKLKQDEYSGLNINQKIIKLFNNADVRDIIDLSNMKPEQAQIVVQNRPFKSMKEILVLDLSENKTKRKQVKSTIERCVETSTQKLQAYTAIDSLLKQCYDYSRSITNEVKKWGVNLKGKTLNGELAITEVNVESEDSESESESEEEIVKKSSKKKKKKFKIDGSEHDEDFNYTGKKKIYKSSIDNSTVSDKVRYFTKKPSYMAEDVVLKDYQQVGINWLHLLFQKQLSCILADEMGLGKTAQVIAFLSHLKKKKYSGPHLIVVPSSTLENWLREFEKFAPSFNVIPYYGSLEEREDLRHDLVEGDYDIVVTTYNLTTGKLDAAFLQTLDFNVIVYDEGHMLKNALSDRYKKLTKLKANFRLLLTGTPLQNNLKELISLLDFILPEVFDSKLEKLQYLFDQKATTKTDTQHIEGENYNPLMSEQAISKAKVMMSPFVLRRTKAQVMKSLPKKHTSIEYCTNTSFQKQIYDEKLRELNEYQEEVQRRKAMDEKEVKKLPSLKKVNTNVLMVLRQICMHPLLSRQRYNDNMLRIMAKRLMKNDNYIDANEDYIFEDFQVMSDFEITQFCHTFPNELGNFVLKQSIYEESGKIKVLVPMIEKIIQKGEKVLIFSLFTQMLDILEKVLSLHNWKFLRLDGQTAVDTRQTIIDKFYEDKTIPVMLLSTKAGGFGINLICASNVIIYDQSLNPHDDRQAEDRAHRVGQTKEVHVTRLITKDSIEENILQMAFNKLQLDNSVMAQNVEDILLKTVEDLISKKSSKKIKSADEEKQQEDNPTTEENAFDAFEAPISLEMNEENADLSEAPVEIQAESSQSGRRRRKRQKIDYVDDLKIPELDEVYESSNEKGDASFAVEEEAQSTEDLSEDVKEVTAENTESTNDDASLKRPAKDVAAFETEPVMKKAKIPAEPAQNSNSNTMPDGEKAQNKFTVPVVAPLDSESVNSEIAKGRETFAKEIAQIQKLIKDFTFPASKTTPYVEGLVATRLHLLNALINTKMQLLRFEEQNLVKPDPDAQNKRAHFVSAINSYISTVNNIHEKLGQILSNPASAMPNTGDEPSTAFETPPVTKVLETVNDQTAENGTEPKPVVQIPEPETDSHETVPLSMSDIIERRADEDAKLRVSQPL